MHTFNQRWVWFHTCALTVYSLLTCSVSMQEMPVPYDTTLRLHVPLCLCFVCRPCVSLVDDVCGMWTLCVVCTGIGTRVGRVGVDRSDAPYPPPATWCLLSLCALPSPPCAPLSSSAPGIPGFFVDPLVYVIIPLPLVRLCCLPFTSADPRFPLPAGLRAGTL